MIWYYCTCSKKTSDKLKVKQGRSPYRDVTADNEGICIDCGHYAIASHRKVDAKSGSLYKQITGYKDEILNKEKRQNKLDRYKYDKKRTNKDGNLDA